jgi:two-component system, NtrC family, response regulator AtoC
MNLSENALGHSHQAPAAATVRHPATEWITVERLTEGAERTGGMLVRSAQFKRLYNSISRFAPYKATVLIQGESGTGKELVARALHSLGPVPNGPFVTFNCSNLVESLAESQLFGHVKGAFTDAREDSLGYFRSANGGTLFLDEIGELPLKLQPKLLRAVETHEVQAVGSAHSHKVDIRLVAATNRDLRAMVKAGQFRDDLFYRLNAAALVIPPLRERRDAIAAFVGHFVEHYSRMFAKEIRMVSIGALEALAAYPWPGNVRELAHAVESAVLMTDGDRIGINELPEVVADKRQEPASEAAPANSIEVEIPRAPMHSEPAAEQEAASPFSLDAAIREASKDALVRALTATHGNCHRAADLLGVSRYTVYRMLARYGLTETRGYRTWRKASV